MRRVAINGKFLTQHRTGVQRVAAEFVAALDRLADDGDAVVSQLSLRVLRPPGEAAAQLRAIPQTAVGALRGVAWEQFSLPRAAGRDVLLNLCNVGPLSRQGDVMFIHDAQAFLTPQSYSAPFRAWYQFALPRLAQRAKAVVTVSDYARECLERFNIAPRHRVQVIHNGVDHILRAPADAGAWARLGLQPDGYVVALSNTQAHKNIKVLFEAFQSSALGHLSLVLVGGASRADFVQAGRAPPANVLFAGRVDDAALRGLLESAAAFAFPSTTEGFGLPPLEAMLLGVPAVVAPCGAMPELCGDAVLYADPDDAADWTLQLARLTADQHLSQGLRAAGRQKAAQYRWETSARQLAQLLSAG